MQTRAPRPARASPLRRAAIAEASSRARAATAFRRRARAIHVRCKYGERDDRLQGVFCSLDLGSISLCTHAHHILYARAFPHASSWRSYRTHIRPGRGRRTHYGTPRSDQIYGARESYRYTAPYWYARDAQGRDSLRAHPPACARAARRGCGRAACVERVVVRAPRALRAQRPQRERRLLLLAAARAASRSARRGRQRPAYVASPSGMHPGTARASLAGSGPLHVLDGLSMEAAQPSMEEEPPFHGSLRRAS